ncbi:MAG: VOC family protein [Gemmatimonadaceae bacterium]
MTDSDTSGHNPGATAGYGIRPPGYRLPDATRIGRVRLQIGDLARSLAYYEQVLGFRVLDRSAGRATLGAHGNDAPLIELHEAAGAAPVPPTGRLGLYHFAILLPSRAALGRFIARIGQLDVEVGASDHLVSEAVYLHDPDGLGVEIYADRPRASWARHGGQIVMGTRPLDVPDLARASNGEVWTGMPAGTTVGHVHLHVGNIDQATAFFHTALGLDAVVWSYPGALFLSAGGYHHHLGVNSWPGTRAKRPGDGDARLLEWEIVVPRGDATEAAARSMEAAGHAVVRDNTGWTIADPWGTVLRVAIAELNE